MPTVKDQVEALNKEAERERLEDRKHLYISAIIALAALKPHPEPKVIDIEHLDRNALVAIVKKTHDCFIHYSGNCGILSGALLFNLKAGKILLRVSNSHIVLRGLHRLAVNKLLLSGPGSYQTFETVSGIKKLEQKLLDNYSQTGERFYRVCNSHHQWNAVILIEQNKPVVQFVDAWKTSNSVPTAEEFAKTCAAEEEFDFDIEFTHGTINFSEVVKKIENKGEIRTNFDLDTFKRAFLLRYNLSHFSFFKTPFSSVEVKLEKFTTIDDVLKHAAKKPDSKVTEVLKSLGAISTETSPFRIQ